ncbi:hypothetical protein HED60_19720 [Planctomycetales bacterium ZRK34]|nr:hypothetical protein HED60_19720 [Planctomycetales bacterium ZRK34]
MNDCMIKHIERHGWFRKTGRWICGLALGAALFTGATAAEAGTVYSVYNHADGNAIVGEDVDGTGYVLRLDMGLQKHTFNANTTGDLTLTVDSANNVLILDGYVSHNQSGTNTTAADANDDVYLLHAVFSSPSMTDATPDDLWFGSNDSNTVYGEVLDDLLADATPYADGQTASIYSTSATRLSFFLVELTLTPDSANQSLGKTFPQNRLVWDEFPNDASKPLLIEYDYRMAGAGALGGTGGIETDDTGLRYGASELLFTLFPQEDPLLPPTTVIPTPAALPMGLIGLAMFSVARRRG